MDARIGTAMGIYSQLRSADQAPLLPVDLRAVARAIGNIDIEEREMIPEAAIQPSGSRFVIYLQSNFKDRPGRRVRQRFSLAHEIAHTFFFEIQDGRLKSMRGGPLGIDLESACQDGAGRLLVPEPFLPAEFTERVETTAEDVLRLAKTFDVSLEVALRRLVDAPSLESAEVCFALCRFGKIEYAMYPPWLGILAKPANTSIQGWFRSSRVSIQNWFRASGLTVEILPSGSCIGSSEAGRLTARRVRAGMSTELFEIRRYPERTSEAELRSRLLGFA